MIRPRVVVVLAVLAVMLGAGCGSGGSVTAGAGDEGGVDRAEALLEDPLLAVEPVEGQPAPEASLRRAGTEVQVLQPPLHEHQVRALGQFEGDHLEVAQRYLDALLDGGWSEIDVFCIDDAAARLVTLKAARWVGYRIEVVTVVGSDGVTIALGAPPSGRGGPRPADTPAKLGCLEKEA